MSPGTNKRPLLSLEVYAARVVGKRQVWIGRIGQIYSLEIQSRITESYRIKDYDVTTVLYGIVSCLHNAIPFYIFNIVFNNYVFNVLLFSRF